MSIHLNKLTKLNRQTFATICLTAGLLVISPQSPASETGSIHWCYDKAECAPAKWGQLDKRYEVCATGKKQSPVDLPAAAVGNGPLDVIYQPTQTTKLVNNGHAWQVDYSAGIGALNWGGKTFKLVQFHFHSPSEHTVVAKSFPMEVHLVHAADNDLAVIGVFFREGKENAFLQKFWNQLPQSQGEVETQLQLNAEELIPALRGFQSYQGSLTTPSCDERVQWIVMTEPLEASKEQIAAFQKAMHGDGARPTQPLNGRKIETQVYDLLYGNWTDAKGHKIQLQQNGTELLATIGDKQQAQGKVTGHIVTMELEGQEIIGKESEDGKMISWANGDKWVKQ